jgi:glycine cleavage system aminomethyltransferase T
VDAASTMHGAMAQRFVFEGQPTEFVDGDTVAVAAIRHSEHPANGGALCLTGDCGNCVAEVDGIAFVRTCQTLARPGMVVGRHPVIGAPSLYASPAPDRRTTEDSLVEHLHVEVAVIGGRSHHGALEADRLRAEGRNVVELDAQDGNEVVAIYSGPLVITRTPSGFTHVHADEVVVATGAAEILPVCPGSTLKGILTVGAFEKLRAAGVELGRAVSVGIHPDRFDGIIADGELMRFEGTDQVENVVVKASNGMLHRHHCDTVVVGLGRASRDLLSRMAGPDPHVRVIGPAAELHPLPAAPTEGVVCGCSKTTVEDLQGVWDRGFREVELIKRSSLCGTGTCQGGACMPHLLAFVEAQNDASAAAAPFTARPASRQLTMGEAAAGIYVDAWRRTPLHDEHLKLGANMDRFGTWWRPWNYGDHVAEYWAVREGVSIGDVSTLGKFVVTGPDAVEALERIYPTTIADIKPGRSRYVLVLNERGHVFDDGMVIRETEDRFVLSFTSGGASNAEAWLRDWFETWDLDVRLMDRTQSLAAINVTGPLAGELLQRLGVTDPPKFLTHRHDKVAGIPCHIMRLSFTGEASWELHHPWNRSVELWRALLEAGRDLGIKPHGLQALFGLRLEKGHVIVGMDTEMDTTPKRIAHDWAVKMNKPFFVGREALVRTSKLPDSRRMIGVRLDGPAPIEGTPIIALPNTSGCVAGDILGHVATCFHSPLLGYTIGLGWLKRGWSPTEPLMAAVSVDAREATLVEPPFYDVEGKRARA